MPSTARLLLEEYQRIGMPNLAYDGYLDLLQRVWGCVVVGDGGAVEIGLVDGRGGADVFGEEEPQTCALTLVWLSP